MLWRVAVLRSDVSEELTASIISVTRIDELRMSTATSKRHTLRNNIPEDGILHSHRQENLNSNIALTGWAL
jgi:hypothetical protein